MRWNSGLFWIPFLAWYAPRQGEGAILYHLASYSSYTQSPIKTPVSSNRYDQTYMFWMTAESNGRQNPIHAGARYEGTIIIEPDLSLTYYYGPGTGDLKTSFSSGAVITWNKWMHVAVTRQITSTPRKLCWYINGNLTATQDAPYAVAGQWSGNANHFIGGGGWLNDFKGKMRGFYIYDEALSQAQIQAAMTRDSPYVALSAVGEMRRTSANSSSWKHVSLAQSYTDPILVIGDPTNFDSRIFGWRVKDVAESSFAVKGFGDDAHTGSEELHYIVLDRGDHMIDGVRFLAGKTTGQYKFEVQFHPPFRSAPYFMPFIRSFNQEGWMEVRGYQITAGGAWISISPVESIRKGPSAAVSETVSWIAFERSPATFRSGSYVSALGSFNSKYQECAPTNGSAPTTNISILGVTSPQAVFIVKIMSRNGVDPITARWMRKAPSSPSLDVCWNEDRTFDDDLAHNLESFVVLAQNSSAVIHTSSPTSAPSISPTRSPTVSLAFNKPTEQSSTAQNRQSSKAVDGNPDPRMEEGSCSQTENGHANPFNILNSEEVRPGVNVNRGSVRTVGPYILEFKLKVMGIVSGWGSIVHFTTKDNCCKNGDRVPGIWLKPGTSKLHFRTGTSPNSNDGCDPTESLGLNRYYSIKMEVYQNSTIKIFYDGRQVCSRTMSGAIYPAGSIVTVYVGDPWHTSPNAMLKDLSYRKNDPNKRLLGTTDMLQGMTWWRVNLLAVYPIAIVRVMSRGDCCADELRGFQVQISNSVNNASYICNPSGAGETPLAEWYYVSCPSVSGDVVTIIRNNTNASLSLCEVEVFSHGHNITVAPTRSPITSSPTSSPLTQSPATMTPTCSPRTDSPSCTPTTSMPTTRAPSFSPTSCSPTLSPSSLAPTSLAPTSCAPSSLSPSTTSPTSISPSTLAPSSLSPATISPTLEPPKAVLAQLNDAVTALVVTFSRETNAPSLSCDELLSSSTISLLGASPSCLWRSLSELQVNIGPGFRVELGSLIGVRGGKIMGIEPGANLHKESHALPLRPPTNPPAVVAYAYGPEFIGGCAATVDLRATTSGAAGKEISLEWKFVGSSELEAINATAQNSLSSIDAGIALLPPRLFHLHRALKNITSTTLHRLLELPALNLTMDQHYDFAVRATNWLGDSGISEIFRLRKVKGLSRPTIFMPSPLQITVQRSRKLGIKVRVRPPSCMESRMRMGVQGLWTVLANIDNIKIPDPESLYLSLPPNTLSVGRDYHFRLFVKAVNVLGQETGNANVTFTVRVKEEPVVAKLRGGIKRVVFVGDSSGHSTGSVLSIDASGSRDPIYPENILMYNATVFDTRTGVKAASVTSVLPKMQFRSERLTAGSEYRIALNVSSVDGSGRRDTRYALATQLIQTTSERVPIFSITSSGKSSLESFNTDSKLSLSAVFNPAGPSPLAGSFNWSWTWDSPNFPGMDFSQLLTPPDGSSPNLVLMPRALTPGYTYTFTFTARSNATGSVASASIAIVTNLPPSLGQCTITPSQGMALITDFRLSCHGWSDTDLPLQYRFEQVSSPGGTALSTPALALPTTQQGGGEEEEPSYFQLCDWRLLEECVTQLPAPEKPGALLNVRATVADFLGANAYTNVVANVTQARDLQIADVTGRLLDSFGSGDLQSLAVGILGSMSYLRSPLGKDSNNATSVGKFREEILGMLATLSPARGDGSARQLSPSNAASLLAIVTDFTSPQELTGSAVGSAISLLDDINSKLLGRKSNDSIDGQMLVTTTSAQAEQEEEEESDGNAAETVRNSLTTLSNLISATAAYKQDQSALPLSSVSSSTSGRLESVASASAYALAARTMPGEKISRAKAASAPGRVPIELASIKLSSTEEETLIDGLLTRVVLPPISSLTSLIGNEERSGVGATFVVSAVGFQGSAVFPVTNTTLADVNANSTADDNMKTRLKSSSGLYVGGLIVIEIRNESAGGGALKITNASKPIRFEVPAGQNLSHFSGGRVAIRDMMVPVCMYWNDETRHWSRDGVWALNFSETTNSTVCETRHLTSFTSDAAFRVEVNQISAEDVSFDALDPTQNPVMGLLIAIVGCFLLAQPLVCALDHRDEFSTKIGSAKETQRIQNEKDFWMGKNHIQYIKSKADREWKGFAQATIWGIRQRHPWFSVLFHHPGDFMNSQKRSWVLLILTLNASVVCALLAGTNQRLGVLQGNVAMAIVASTLSFPIPYVLSSIFLRGTPEEFRVKWKRSKLEQMLPWLVFLFVVCGSDAYQANLEDENKDQEVNLDDGGEEAGEGGGDGDVEVKDNDQENNLSDQEDKDDNEDEKETTLRHGNTAGLTSSSTVFAAGGAAAGTVGGYKLGGGGNKRTFTPRQREKAIGRRKEPRSSNTSHLKQPVHSPATSMLANRMKRPAGAVNPMHSSFQNVLKDTDLMSLGNDSFSASSLAWAEETRSTNINSSKASHNFAQISSCSNDSMLKGRRGSIMMQATRQATFRTQERRYQPSKLGVVHGVPITEIGALEWHSRDIAAVLFCVIICLGLSFLLIFLSWANKESNGKTWQISMLAMPQDLFFRTLAILFFEAVFTMPLHCCSCYFCLFCCGNSEKVLKPTRIKSRLSAILNCSELSFSVNNGLIVESVSKAGADKGIQVGWRLLAVNGTLILNAMELRDILQRVFKTYKEYEVEFVASVEAAREILRMYAPDECENWQEEGAVDMKDHNTTSLNRNKRVGPDGHSSVSELVSDTSDSAMVDLDYALQDNLDFILPFGCKQPKQQQHQQQQNLQGSIGRLSAISLGLQKNTAITRVSLRKHEMAKFMGVEESELSVSSVREEGISSSSDEEPGWGN